ncbi:MAG: ABC transporter ATP-binding protein/permease [Treponemataceae bacterium]|nr:ABC transporter ATP-binding protein/permease [Treponemataceae bacterium]
MIEALRKIIRFAGAERKNIRKSIFVSLLYSCFAMLRIGAIYFVITAIVSKESGNAAAWKAFLLLLASIVGMTLTRNVYQMQQTHAGFFMSANKRLDIGNRLKRIPMGFFNNNTIGEISGITTTVLDTVENIGATVLVLVLGGLVNAVVFLLMIPFFDWRIALIVLGGMIVYLLFTSLMEHRTRKLAPKREESKTAIVEASLENIQGMSVVKAFNLAGKGDAKLRAAIDRYRDNNLALEKMFIPISIVQNIFLGAFKMLIIFASAYFYLNGSMEPAIAFIMIIVSFQVFNDIEQTDAGLSMLRLVTSSIDQAEKIDAMPQLDEQGKDYSPQTHDIKIENVSFAYGTKEILHDISLNIPQNTMTAFVGPSGAGKTTLALLISRFWDVKKGSISIGGKDIREYTLESLMAQISLVFQNVYLFADTVENNIRFGCPDASRKEVIQAAKRACCHDFIMSLPDGYDTVIGEGGATLSGGEKQRISIARAILKDAPIIILDEATANVDPENEDKLKLAFEALTKDKTVIMIAHRLNTIRNADQIVVINAGGLTAGTHDELMKTNRIYNRFVNMREKAADWQL